MKERFSAMGADPVGNARGRYTAILKSEMAIWAKLVKAAGICGE